jgi:hypothetical protein
MVPYSTVTFLRTTEKPYRMIVRNALNPDETPEKASVRSKTIPKIDLKH